MAKSPTGFSLAIEYLREEDGRRLADIAALPGVRSAGAWRVPGPMNVSFIAA